ncbi:MAG: cytochrome-c peroxidase, partial [Bacteroidota bacterium]
MKLKGYIYVLLPIGVLLMAFAQELRHLHLPTHFPAPQYDFADNPANEEAFQLGRALFYDPGLSADNSISCASCHSPYHAFAHTDHDLSHGIHDSVGTRNAPALFNLAWQSSFMWDGAIQHLDMQALAPISHPGEMGSSLPKVISYLQADTRYPVLFEAAFGDSVISGEYVLKALAQFQLGLISSNAKYDSVQRGESNFTVQEQSGYLLFQQHCNVCHTEPLFMNNGFANNGLSLDSSLMDYGRIAISQQPEEITQRRDLELQTILW